tara:strand:- start:120 stop:842 length:723 start_codon:yes stop_codon:yes gene_type:complete
MQAVSDGGYGHRELVVRVNSLNSDWGHADIEAFAQADISAMLFPKVESVHQLEKIDEVLASMGGSTLKRWLMIETPGGVLELESLANHSLVEAIVLGTSDLVKELRAVHTRSRNNISYALQRSVLVARWREVEIFDGVHLDYQNLETLREACVAAREMGFDGKTLIHPDQVQVANEVFGHSFEDYERAKEILKIWDKALGEGKGVAVLDGQLIENLHAEEARRIVLLYEELEKRGNDGSL